MDSCFFYSNISSCVIKNGFASEHFSLSRGVRQGCPLSGLLFITGIEILGNAIRNSGNIKGTDIEPKTCKAHSIRRLHHRHCKGHSVHILQSFRPAFQFEKCSGLRINQSKSELLWLGSSREYRHSHIM